MSLRRSVVRRLLVCFVVVGGGLASCCSDDWSSRSVGTFLFNINTNRKFNSDMH